MISLRDQVLSELAKRPRARTIGARIDVGWVGTEGPESDTPLAPGDLEPVERSQAVARALEWANAGLLYCQTSNGGTDSHGLCEREPNAEWDPYRSDCSGLVSWAWKLPPPGRTTATFAPFDDAVSYQITPEELQPGDALNKKGHIVLVKGFPEPGVIEVIEEFDFRQPAAVHTIDFVVDDQGMVIRKGAPFFPIRYRAIEPDKHTGIAIAGVTAAAALGIYWWATR